MRGAGDDLLTPSLVKQSRLDLGARPGLRSALYEGKVTHRRFGPGPSREFTYPVRMPLLYLDEVASLTRLHPFFSARRPAPIWLRRADFLGPETTPLEKAALDLVEERLDLRPAGSVALLANLRTWGWLFNPISLYLCTGADEKVEALVVEVENTPWHERHSYVVGPPGRHRFAKVLHVSPFLPMEDVSYELSYGAPAERFALRLDVLEGSERLLGVTMSLRRRPLDHAALARLVWRRPAGTYRVSTGIYHQAARLALRRAPFYVHPGREKLKK
jgi:DUF1365 family protein